MRVGMGGSKNIPSPWKGEGMFTPSPLWGVGRGEGTGFPLKFNNL